MPNPTSSKNRSESVPLQVPSDCPRLGCGASEVDPNLVRALSANSFLLGPLRER